MTAPLNGHTPPAPDPVADVAQAVTAALRAEAPDSPAWADLTDEDQAAELYLAQHYLAAHSAWLKANGFRIVPPGSVLRPATEQEAMMMVQGAKAFLDGQKRKGKLMDGAVSRKVIVPKGTLQ